MFKLNGIKVSTKIDFEWDDFQYMIEEELNSEYIKVNEITRDEDTVNASFKILKEDKVEEVKNSFKKYCTNPSDIYVLKEIEEEINECENHYEEVKLNNDTILKILESILSKDIPSIEPYLLEADYYGVGVVFNLKNSILKSSIKTINQDSVTDDLTKLLEDLEFSIEKEELNQCIKNNLQRDIDFNLNLRSILDEYLKDRFSNYTIDILKNNDNTYTTYLCVSQI